MMTDCRTGVRVGVLTSALIGAMVASAAAQQGTGPEVQNRGIYIGGGFGANIQEDNRFRGGAADSNAEYDLGYIGLLNLGYAFGNGLRLEVEPGYRHNNLDKSSGATGHGRSYIESLMFNGVYDFNLAVPLLPGWQPHLGLGAGMARVDNHSAPHGAGFLVSGNDTVLAFQGIAGIEYAVSPAVKLGVDYRYFLAHDANFHNESTGARVKGGDIIDHAILLTFRYEFGAPERPQPVPTPVAQPAPPPVPTPAATRPAPQTFLVFFEFDRATFTNEGKKVVEAAAQYAKTNGKATIDVSGYTDLSGTASYNMALSKRRADTVARYLETLGIPRSGIVEAWHGEENPRVPTPDGVREPQNRRVEIVMP